MNRTAVTVAATSRRAAGPPTISGLSPSSGSTAGGTSVVITGTGFTGATAVSFGATAAASYVVDSSTQITAVSPAVAVSGAVSVSVTTPAGTGGSASFTFTQVTITSDGFSGTSANLNGLSTDAANGGSAKTWKNDYEAHHNMQKDGSGRVYMGSASTGWGGACASVDAGTTDVEVSLKTTTRQGTGNDSHFGVAARVSSDGFSGYIMAVYRNSSGIYRYVVGKSTGQYSQSYFTDAGPSDNVIATPADGDVMKLKVSGSTITAYVNGSQVGQWTDTTFTSGNRHGLWGNSIPSGVGLWDNFLLQSL